MLVNITIYVVWIPISLTTWNASLLEIMSGRFLVLSESEENCPVINEFVAPSLSNIVKVNSGRFVNVYCSWKAPSC